MQNLLISPKTGGSSAGENHGTQSNEAIAASGRSTATAQETPRDQGGHDGRHPSAQLHSFARYRGGLAYRQRCAAGILEAAAPIPAAKDLREKWWAINDQGTTGSCVGWATANSVLRWHFAKAGRLTIKQLLSPRFIWMAAKETDEFNTRPTTFIETDGTSLKAALDIAELWLRGG